MLAFWWPQIRSSKNKKGKRDSNATSDLKVWRENWEVKVRDIGKDG